MSGATGFLFTQDVAEVASLIGDAGNLIPLSTGGSITAITDDSTQEAKQIIGQAYLNEAVGRVVMFYVTPSDAALVLVTGAFPPLLNFEGEQFTCVLVGDVIRDNLTDLVTLAGHSITNLWPHRFNIYGTGILVDDVTGFAGAPTITLKASNVMCFYNYTANIDDPAAVARIKRPSFFTRDTISCPYNTVVSNADYFVNVTTQPDGTATPRFGEIHKLQGAPKYRHPTAILPVGFLELQAMTDENPPSALETIAKAISHTGQSYWDLLATST